MSNPERIQLRGSLVRAAMAALLALPAAQATAAWPLALGGNGVDEVVVVKTASNGDVFLAGHFHDSIEVNGATLVSRGLRDVFVARIGAGGQIKWVRTGGSDSSDTVRDLVLDASNNAYVVGDFFGTAQFGGSSVASAGVDDGFIAKLDANGAWQWAQRMGGSERDHATGVVALPGNGAVIPNIPESVVVVGSYKCSASFSSGGSLSQSTHCFDGARDLFIARLKATDGSTLWVRDRGSAGSGIETADHVVVDSSNRLHIVGSVTDGGLQTLHHGTFEGGLGPWSTSDGNRGLTFATNGVAVASTSGGFFGNTAYPYGYNFFTGSVALALRGGGATVTSPALASTGGLEMRISASQMRGFEQNFAPDGYVWPWGYINETSTVSEFPDYGEDLHLEYLGNDNVWRQVARLPGGGTAGERLDHDGNDAYRITDPRAFHAGFRLRYRMPFGSGGYTDALGQARWYDWWYVDNVSIQMIGAPTVYMLSVSNVLTDSPALGTPVELPDALRVEDVAVNAAGTRLVLHGQRAGAIQWSNCTYPAGSGIFLASIALDGGNACSWSKVVDDDSLGAVQPGGVAVDATGNVYVTGGFSGVVEFNLDEGGTLEADGDSDVFIASLDAAGNWRWVTGGDYVDADGVPSLAGGDGDDAGSALATAGGGTLYVGGRFEGTARFGAVDSVVAAGASDAFLANLGTNGRFFEQEKWIVGVPLVPPPEAETRFLSFVPEFRIAGEPYDALGEKVFLWAPPVAGNGNRAQLIPLQPFGSIEVYWRVKDQPLESAQRTTPSLGAIAWPVQPCGDAQTSACYQVHVAGAPVEVEPATGGYRVRELVVPGSGSSGATYGAGSFNAERGGSAVLVYVQGPTLDESQYPLVVDVIRTLPYATVPMFADGVPAEIGTRITDPYHNEPARTGYVVNELAFYDGTGTEPAYNRAARTGAIVPVNRYSNARQQEQGRELAVAWYHRKARGVYWPEKAVRYQPYWPFDPERLIIASEQGSEVLGQLPLSAAQFPSARIYIQNDFDAPGYNPNDEHAFMAPSNTGSGSQAVFALRADFGNGIADDASAASDPYTLVKYFDNAALQWKFRVFRVMATGGGFEQFRYSGTAGTTVSPPYPVRLLPGCGESFVEGQALGEQPPPPFFQDYKNQLWAKSAGSGAVMYYYPAQPGFFTDLDNNDVLDEDAGPGLCVPWLARLPASMGGSASPLDPIRVAYDISWPDEAPLLVSGETLLTPKRGLPDILNQAAVEVVYDDIQASTPDPLPGDTLAQLVDPLGDRAVALAVLPESLATDFQTDGTTAILGSADGTIKLPVSVRERIYYDGMGKQLVLAGVFDESGAGEPFLLLNVLSKRDRVALKRLDGGDGSEESDYVDGCDSVADDCTWDQAVEALFRLSRNPQGIATICEASHLSDTRERICDNHRLVDENDVLIGYQDENADGILEPLQAVGASTALTAGLSQGSGYLTLAFNNDPSLNPLPVSLEIIQVGCLVSPPPPQTATLVSTYQGQINVISPDDIFDEQLVLRHSGDFGGNPDALEFEWFFHPDTNGTPPMPLPDPATGQMNGWIQFPTPNPQGQVEISIEGANIQTLSDNWYLARYRGLPTCNNGSQWSLWAGQPGATPLNQRAQLAQGWVKRVLSRLNPFEARVQDFGQTASNTYASMLVQLGERYSGPIALTNDPDYLNSIGLIEAYTTVMRRALQLSADSTPPVNYEPANAAILLVASRLVDFYTLLGNEAYADAQDPTIGITTENGSFSLAPSIFNFQNQLDSLLSEELVLLRGRDDSGGPVAASPVYNRLFWNFTTGDGEVAYALSYHITDQTGDGILDEFDARILFPQGHGDAWGHYLTGTKIYYDLLRHPFYSWNPRPEAVTVAGVPITVDFLDERQFAETAAAKARAGAEVVDLTYRSAFVENPDGQWQGYEDTDPERAWGLSEWGRRAGMGAYFDWLTVNSVLPDEDPDPSHTGLQRIQRSTVSHLDAIALAYQSVQAQVDKADAGLNPLGLAKGVVTFDIDPSQLDRFNKTQFEQVFDRAMAALNNALQVWDFANELNNQLRRTQNSADDLYVVSREAETDALNQLIEIFGYPYADDIGGSGLYPAGYDGPDMYHYMFIDVPALAGTAFDFDNGLDLGVKRVNSFTGVHTPVAGGLNFFDMSRAPPNVGLFGTDGIDCTDFPLGGGCPLGELDTADSISTTYTTIESPDYGFWFTKPEGWTGQRRAPGRLQQVLQEMLQSRISLKQALVDYDRLRLEIEAQRDTLQATFDIAEANINLSIAQRNELKSLTIATEVMKNSAIAARRIGEFLDTTFKGAVDCIPKSLIAGLAAGGDIASGARCAVTQAANIPKFALDTAADALDIASNATDAAKEDVTELSGIRTSINDATLDLYNVKGELDKLLREEPVLRAEVFARTEAIKQQVGEYHAALAEGLRIFERLTVQRKDIAAGTQQYRYQDMAFRLFRNDALQKYRASFDLAARYVYLAAAAYDYETNLLDGDSQAGAGFLTDIVKERGLGQVINGVPVAGSPGLANTMAQMKLNFDVLKGQMGFNNPQVETNRFSLRRELFRIPAGPDGDADWRAKLEAARVDDLWRLPEFRRYARPFAPESAGPQPGLVLEFSSNVTFGMNFFGWELGPQDSSYDSSQFATRVRSVGAWFEDYAGLPLADDPRIYIFPVGADVLRAPAGDDFATREWQIVEQAVPLPFPIGAAELDDYDWHPVTDTLDGASTELRRFGRLRAYHFSEPFDDSQVTADSRLIGRSVWNRRWMIVIPGGTFLNDPVEGLDTFIHGQRVPGSSARDGDGVDDIRIFFKTYAYSGL